MYRALTAIHATDEPTTEEHEAGAATKSANLKDDADSNPLAVPSSTIAPAVPEL